MCQVLSEITEWGGNIAITQDLLEGYGMPLCVFLHFESIHHPEQSFQKSLLLPTLILFHNFQLPGSTSERTDVTSRSQSGSCSPAASSTLQHPPTYSSHIGISCFLVETMTKSFPCCMSISLLLDLSLFKWY